MSAGEIEVHFIDVGQGDAIYVRTEEHHLLIDGGERGETVPDYLESQGVTQLDLIIATHPHADHIGGLINVLQRFPVAEIMDPAVPHTTRTFEEYLTLIDEYDIPFTEGRAGMSRNLGDVSLTLLSPQNPSEDDLNGASMVTALQHGTLQFLFTGDAEAKAEASMVNSGHNLKSAVLKVGHHGSYTSTSPDFLAAVNPDIAIIMCGTDNRYGHPHDVVLSRLEQAGVALYRTDLHGTIVVRSNGQHYEVTSPAAPISTTSAPPGPPPGRIDLNSADLEALQEIIHIGEKRAQEIIHLRPHRRLEDLRQIDGIGAGRLRDIREEGKAWVQ